MHKWLLLATTGIIASLGSFVGSAGATTPAVACDLITAAQAATLLGTSHVNQLRGLKSECIYVPSAPLPSGSAPTSSIEIVLTTTRNTVRTVQRLLDPHSITYVTQPGHPALNTARHFLTVRGVRAVYTLQGNPAKVQLVSGDSLPQANLSTVVKGWVIQVVVSGMVRPQGLGERAMSLALRRI
jgi:hypothetical protein